MQATATKQAEQLLRDALKELELPKGSVLSGVQKLVRAATMLNNDDVRIWCEIQLGNLKYTMPLSKYSRKVLDYDKISKSRSSNKDKLEKDFFSELHHVEEQLSKLGMKQVIHYSIDEINVKFKESGGGYVNIGFVEEKYNDLVRTKRGNDGTYYKNNLSNHINYVRNAAHSHANSLYNAIAFANTPQTSLDILREAVDNKLLDLAPELAEKLMIAFRSVSSTNPEEWSHALTTCRRFIEGLADVLFPPVEEKINGRLLGKPQYINRLWAFMDKAIESESNRELAKAHVDYLGSYLHQAHKLSNKGVHVGLDRMEAIKAVFHTYMLVADILDYLDTAQSRGDKKLNIHLASLDELESVLGINRNMAKEIIRLRVEHVILTPEIISKVKGFGPKTISKMNELLSFDPNS